MLTAIGYPEGSSNENYRLNRDAIKTGDLNKPIKFYSIDSDEVGAEVKCIEFQNLYNTIATLT